MTPLLAWFLGSAVTAALVLAVCIALLQRSLRSVLTDLLGSPIRARFFTISLCALLATITLAGCLLPAHQLDLTANTSAALQRNASKQLLAAGAALLVGLGAAGSLLLILITKFEARRA